MNEGIIINLYMSESFQNITQGWVVLNANTEGEARTIMEGYPLHAFMKTLNIYPVFMPVK